ncbi:MAG TPA: hypothetical protein VFT00_01800 [Nocardioides sp.]|nr:hypothetical protein [Nocardioides sp.]
MTADGWNTDDELRARLHAADPASSLPPADPSRVARLLEDTMSSSNDGDLMTRSRETGTHGRNPLTWLVAAAAVLLIAGAGAYGLMNRDTGTPAPGSTTATSTVTELSAPVASSAKCMVPSAEVLGQQSLAFEGTVQEVTDGKVVLNPTNFYAGDVTDLVTVTASTADLQALVGAVDFQEGKNYLVSASDGRVSVCGLSGPWSADLAALYQEAFPG